MIRITSVFAVFYFVGLSVLRADSTIASVQQQLKDQGFYYGEVTGNKDADTTAAIRRYQIRNGLQINGELNAQTQKSLGLKVTTPEKPASIAPPPPSRNLPPDAPVLRASPPASRSTPMPEADNFPPPAPSPMTRGYPSGASEFFPQLSGVFYGTPYEVASLEMQRRIVGGAQTMLTRRGYYRGVLDGDYGPNTAFAIRAFQARFRLETNGRLDMKTLSALGLLPGQRAPGVTAPLRRNAPRPGLSAPRGERVYIPR